MKRVLRVLIKGSHGANRKAAAVEIELHGDCEGGGENFHSLPRVRECRDQQSAQIVGEQSGAKCSKAHHTITAARGNNKRISPFALPSGESFSLSFAREGGRKMKTFNQHFRKTSEKFN
jgi:hypothetical protein